MASNLFKVAFAVLIVGWAPMLLYLVFVSGGGAPHGLSLLARASVPISLFLAMTSGIVFLLRSWRESRA